MAGTRYFEKKIAQKLIADLLDAGFTLGVFDSEQTTLENSADADAVLKAMFTTDDEKLLVYKDGKSFGWVYFVYGNSGYDVINDYTVNLEEYMKGANELAEEFEGIFDK